MTKYENKKYAMGMEAETTPKHPYGPGAAEQSPEELVRKGRKYNGGQSYLEVARQLQEQANLRERGGRYHRESVKREGARFKEAAELAFRKARAERRLRA